MASVFNLRNATFTISDYASAHFIAVVIGDGNIVYEEKINREYLMNRGHVYAVVNGDDVPMDVSFDFWWQYIRGTGGTVTVEDALKQVGNASGWTSSDSDNCSPYCVDLTILFTPLCLAEAIESVVLPYFRYESLNHDAKARQISCKGRCNATMATVTRIAQ